MLFSQCLVQRAPTYSCPAGYTLIGTQCQGRTPPDVLDATPGCTSGFGFNVNTGMCQRVYTGTYVCASGTLTGSNTCVTYSCPSGYSLIGGARCQRVVLPTYSCPSGYTMQGAGPSTTCRRAVAPTYSCPSGHTLSGGQCIHSTPTTTTPTTTTVTPTTSLPPDPSISGLASAGTILAGATYIDAFTVRGSAATVTGTGCSLLHTYTSPSGTSRGYTLSVARADAGRRFCDVAAGSASQAVTVTFTGIAGLASGLRGGA